MEALIGPFFWYENKVMAGAEPLDLAEKYGNKLTSKVSHAELYDSFAEQDEYMLTPRGRVVWDIACNQAIIYIDKCLCEESMIENIARAFQLEGYTIEYDDHYICPNCEPNAFAHLEHMNEDCTVRQKDMNPDH